MHRRALVTAVLAALALPANARGALFFLLDRPAAEPNGRVTVRTGWTPQEFELRERVKPFQRPVRIYLVAANLATDVHSRFDRRLHYVGSFVPDRNGRGLLTFTTPPLDPATYTIAYWCPACATYSRGRTFTVQQPGQFVPRYRSQALLRLESTDACPVTVPNRNRPPRQPRAVTWHGNGLLWAGLDSDGVYSVPRSRVAADGSIFNKLPWVTSPPTAKPSISGERIDAPAPPLRVHGVNLGSFSGDVDPSFMSAVDFPTPGCWRLTARVRDVSLAYVVRVVVRTG